MELTHSQIKLRTYSFAFITACVAFSSMLYELLLAQAMAAVLGNTMLRFTMTMGLYLFSLGIGALSVGWLFKKPSAAHFIALELLLCILGLSLPVLLFLGDSFYYACSNLWQWDGGSRVGQMLLWMYMHSWVVLVGIICGAEIPLLIMLAKEKLSSEITTKIFIYDYIFSCLPCFIFPAFLYYQLGIVGGFALCALINASAACVYILSIVRPIPKRLIFLTSIAFFLSWCGMYFEGAERLWIGSFEALCFG